MKQSVRRASCVGGLIAVSLLGTGCAGVGGIRPSFPPLQAAEIDTIATPPSKTIGAVSAAVIAQGLSVQWAAPREGYLETKWYDTDRRVSVSGPGPSDVTRTVRLRFWVDSLAGGRSLLTSEADYLQTLDPSEPDRDLEVMAPPGHPGRVILDDILSAVEKSGGS